MQIAEILAFVAFIVAAVLAGIHRDHAMVALALGLVFLTWVIHPLA